MSAIPISQSWIMKQCIQQWSSMQRVQLEGPPPKWSPWPLHQVWQLHPMMPEVKFSKANDSIILHPSKDLHNYVNELHGSNKYEFVFINLWQMAGVMEGWILFNNQSNIHVICNPMMFQDIHSVQRGDRDWPTYSVMCKWEWCTKKGSLGHSMCGVVWQKGNCQHNFYRFSGQNEPLHYLWYQKNGNCIWVHLLGSGKVVFKMIPMDWGIVTLPALTQLP